MEKNFEKAIKENFAGKSNAGLRKALRNCTTAEEVRAKSNSVALTPWGLAGLEAVAKTLEATK